MHSTIVIVCTALVVLVCVQVEAGKHKGDTLVINGGGSGPSMLVKEGKKGKGGLIVLSNGGGGCKQQSYKEYIPIPMGYGEPYLNEPEKPKGEQEHYEEPESYKREDNGGESTEQESNNEPDYGSMGTHEEHSSLDHSEY